MTAAKKPAAKREVKKVYAFSVDGDDCLTSDRFPSAAAAVKSAETSIYDFDTDDVIEVWELVSRHEVKSDKFLKEVK
jgi:hypothetical protein